MTVNYYIETYYINDYNISIFFKKILQKNRNIQRKTALLIGNEKNNNLTRFFLDTNTILSSKITTDKTLFNPVKHTEILTNSNIIDDVFIIDTNQLITAKILNELNNEHTIHYLSNEKIFSSEIINYYDTSKDNMFINVLALVNKKIIATIISMYPEYQDIFSKIHNCNLYEQPFFSPYHYLMVNKNKISIYDSKNNENKDINIDDIIYHQQLDNEISTSQNENEDIKEILNIILDKLADITSKDNEYEYHQNSDDQNEILDIFKIKKRQKLTHFNSK